MLRKPPVELTCRPQSCGVADWAAGRLYEIMLCSVWVGQPSEGQALPCQAMATTRIKDSKWEEDDILFTPTLHATWINYNICEGEEWRRRRIHLFKAKISMHKRDQGKKDIFVSQHVK
jgi:hypothetical protein